MTDQAFDANVVDRPLSKAQARALRRQDRAKCLPGSKPLEAKTANQSLYLNHLQAGRSVFAVGGAGTGKTYLPARIAARALIEGRVEKIIVCRVTVSKAKHALGFLPGKLEQKLAPWLVPVMDGLRAEASANTLELWQKEGKLEFVSFEHMRGRTFNDAFVLLDEGQNADLGDLALFLTRTGENSQVVVTGDMDQIDIHDSGLNKIIEIALEHEVPMEVVRFTSSDVVRSALAKAWVKALERNRNGQSAPKAISDVAFLDARRDSQHNAPLKLHAG